MIFIIKADLVSGAYMPDGDVSRTIRIGGSHTLDDLCRLILDSIAFDHDHQYLFSFGEQAYSMDESKVYALRPGTGEHSTKEKLYRLSLREGSRFWLVYDFGDDWTFSLTVEKALDESGNIKPSVIDSTGTVEQYPDSSLLESPEKNTEEAPADTPLEGNSTPGRGIPLEGIKGIGADDLDVSDEYFDADKSGTRDTNPVLGRIMLRVVERQIEIGDPAFVKEAYGQLQEKGYIRKAAKIRLATALSNEVFEILKYNKKYDENRYRGFVQDLLAEPFDPDMIPDLETGKEHLISEGLSEFNQKLMNNDAEGAADRFSELWPEIREWIENNYTRMTGGKLLRFSVDAIDESMDYRMNLYNSIMDSGMAYMNARRYEEGVKIQKEILDTFSWEKGKDAEVRDNIGTMLNDMGKTKEADQWFQDWYALSPDDPDCTNSYVFSLQQRGDQKRAREVLEAHLPARPEPDNRYLNLYTRAADLYHEQGDQQKSDFYQGLVDRITRSGGTISPVQFGGAWADGMDPFNGMNPFNENVPAQPVKKDKKIYPNDPCPCGSGKKYKNCCGKNKR